MLKDTAVNVTVQGHKHLGAVIGSREYLEEYVSQKVSNWVSEVTNASWQSLPFLNQKRVMLLTPLA